MMELYDEAKLASTNSYSPYSKFRVGAAVLTFEGKVYWGTNVENGAFEATHAERVAIASAITHGVKKIRAIAVYGETESVPPCGSCRQAIIELDENILVIFKYGGVLRQKLISELLPFQFKL